MKEALFLKRNIDKWKQYEDLLSTSDDPDQLGTGFIELTDDLSYARTFYPNSKTTQYVNGLAANFHKALYKNKKESSNRIFSFWQYELPYLFKKYHRYLLYSFLFFIAFVLVGILSVNRDTNFIRVVLGDHYVNMTLENIRKGDPFGVYKSGGSLSMFLMIAFNNIKVAFLAYIFGITGGIFTVLLLMYNGVMLGSFEAFFFQHGLGWNSVLTIFIHGTIEISVIIIAGCAGLVLAASLLFPKTYNRRQSLIRGGRDALKIVIGVVPFFVIAAFFEGFVTRHYKGIPTVIKIIILSGSLLLIIWYFIIYPILLHHKVERSKNKNRNSLTNNHFKIWLNQKLNSER
ncbi:MAG: stage II sporulation protein M [Chitinophagaceae bacterium]